MPNAGPAPFTHDNPAIIVDVVRDMIKQQRDNASF